MKCSIKNVTKQSLHDLQGQKSSHVNSLRLHITYAMYVVSHITYLTSIHVHTYYMLHILTFMRYFSCFHIMLLHLKLQICFVLPELISAIRSFQKLHYNWTYSNPWYVTTLYNNYASRVLNQNNNIFWRVLQEWTCHVAYFLTYKSRNSYVICHNIYLNFQCHIFQCHICHA